MKRGVGAFIFLFLAVQLLLPLQYYGCRSDKKDERFAWRMFSTTRMVRCQTEFLLGDDKKVINTTRVFHEAWATLATRGRIHVIDAMAAKLCADHEGKGIYVKHACRGVDRKIEEISSGGWNICKIGSIE